MARTCTSAAVQHARPRLVGLRATRAVLRGLEYADDMVAMFFQGTTHFDGVGHAWYGDQIWNGYSADETVDYLSKASVLAVGQKGVVGRATLIDIARFKGKVRTGEGRSVHLRRRARGRRVPGNDCRAARHPADPHRMAQPVLRGSRSLLPGAVREPGLLYDDRVPTWFHEHEIAAFGTDTMAASSSHSQTTT